MAFGAAMRGERFERWLKRVRRKAPRGMARRMAQAVELLVGAVQDELSKGPKDIPSGGGRLENLRLPRNPTSHLRIVTGRLRGSITGRTLRRGRLRYEGRVGPQKVRYAAIHEYGGTAGRGGRTNIKARPYLRPAMRRSRAKVEEILGRQVNLYVE